MRQHRRQPRRRVPRRAGAEVVACCDVDAGRAEAFAARHGIPAAVEPVERCSTCGVDVVSVCTPHPTHEAVVTAAAARGAHVLCEKPIAIDLRRRRAG